MNNNPSAVLLDRTTPPHILTLIFLAGLSALSMTLFLPSLANMATYFATDYALMQLSVAAYLLLNACLHVVIGPASDHFGRRPVVLFSVAAFLVATIGCLLAPSVEIFLIFRMAQAVIVTGMVLSRAIVRDLFPQRQAAAMIGYVTMGMAVAPMIGPVIGGYLDEFFGWKATFALLLLLGGLVFMLCHLDLGETASARPTSFRQQFSGYPKLFKSRRFWVYCLISAMASGSFFAYLGGAPFVGTVYYGLGPSDIGFYFGLCAGGYMCGNFLAGRFSVRLGVVKMIVSGALLGLIGPLGPLVLISNGVEHPLGFFGFVVVMGIGNGMLLPNTTAGLLSIQPQLAGTASGIGGALMIGGGAGLSALSGVLLSEESGPYPLISIMLISALGALLLSFLLARLETRTKSAF